MAAAKFTVAMLGLLVSAVGTADASDELTATSREGLYRLTVRPSADPLPLSQMHHWTLAVTDADGVPVADATIVVTGGMPAHDHGLPTRPQARPTEEVGSYRLEGVRFHMRGAWQLTVSIVSEAGSDTVVLEFTV